MNSSDFGADIFDPGQDHKPSDAGDKPAKLTRKKKVRTRKAKTPAPESDSEAEAAPPPAEPPGDAEAAAAESRADVEAEQPAPDAAKTVRKRRTRTRRKAKIESKVPSAEDPPPAPEADEPAAEPERDPEPEPEHSPDDTERDAGPEEPEIEATIADDAGLEHRDDDGAEAEDSAGTGRSRRRRRRRGKRDDFDQQGADEEARPRRSEPSRARRTDRMIPVPTPGGERHGQRVAILLDVERLLSQVTEDGQEVAFGKLLQSIARRRHLIRAIAYATSRVFEGLAPTLQGSGIETHPLDSRDALPVALAVDAMALASRVDAIVLVPGPERLAPLTSALRAQGVRVEAASFTDEGTEDEESLQTRLRLGAECLFAP